MTECATDSDFDSEIDDPSLIPTHERALEVLDILDAEIAHIQTQIDAYSIEANGRPMPEDRRDWLRRAAYACAMRRNKRHRVMQRDKEIRGTKGRAQTPKKDPAVGLAKQARLHAEAEARRAAKSAEAAAKNAFVAEAAERKAMGRLFMEIARERLSPELFEAIASEANRRRSGRVSPGQMAPETAR